MQTQTIASANYNNFKTMKMKNEIQLFLELANFRNIVQVANRHNLYIEDMLVKIRNLEATIGNQLITLDNFSIRLTSAGMSFYNLLTKVSVNETSIKNWG